MVHDTRGNFFAAMMEDEDNCRVTKSIKIAKEIKIPIRFVDSHQLKKFVKEKRHQNVVLEVGPYPDHWVTSCQSTPEGIKFLNENREAGFYNSHLILAFNHPNDTGNLGNVIRTACFFGVPVIVDTRHSCSLTPTVSANSAGALETTKVFKVKTMSTFLKSLDGFNIIGADCSQGTLIRDLKLKGPTVLVLGNEKHGIDQSCKPLCNTLVRIPGCSSSPDCLDSLNVSVAAGILLSHLK